MDRTTTTQADRTRANKAAYRRLLEEGPNRGDVTAVDELVALDFVGHWLFNSPPLVGREAFRAWLAGSIRAFPDGQMTLDDLLAADDKVVARWTIRGTETGARQSPTGEAQAVSGRRLTTSGIHIARFADGQLIELWHSQDLLSTYQQLGLLPEIAH